jgi:hypothetical protein
MTDIELELDRAFHELSNSDEDTASEMLRKAAKLPARVSERFVKSVVA